MGNMLGLSLPLPRQEAHGTREDISQEQHQNTAELGKEPQAAQTEEDGIEAIQSKGMPTVEHPHRGNNKHRRQYPWDTTPERMHGIAFREARPRRENIHIEEHEDQCDDDAEDQNVRCSVHKSPVDGAVADRIVMNRASASAMSEPSAVDRTVPRTSFLRPV